PPHCSPLSYTTLFRSDQTAIEQTRHTPLQVVMPTWGVCVFESHHAADFRMEVSRHDELEVFYVLGGAGAFELTGQTVACSPGDRSEEHTSELQSHLTH